MCNLLLKSVIKHIEEITCNGTKGTKKICHYITIQVLIILSSKKIFVSVGILIGVFEFSI